MGSDCYITSITYIRLLYHIEARIQFYNDLHTILESLKHAHTIPIFVYS